MASLRVLAFDHEGRPVAFDTSHDDLQLNLLGEIKDSVSLFDHVTGVAPAPPAKADGGTRSQCLSRDATAHLAICNHLPVAECTHFGQHRTAQALYDTVVARHSSPTTAALGCLLLPYLFPKMSAFATIEDLPPMFITLYFIVSRFPDSLRSVRDRFLSLDPTSLTVDLLEQHLLTAETSAVAVGAARGTPRSPFFEGCSPSPLSPSFASAAAADVSVTEDVGATSTCAKHRSSKGKGGRGGGGGCGGGGGGSGSGGGGSGGGGGGSGGGGGGGTGGGSGGSGGGGGGSGGSGGNGGGGSGGGRSGPWRGGPGGVRPARISFARVSVRARNGKFHTEHRCFSRLDDAWRAEFGDDVKRPRWMDLLRSGVAIFDLDYDDIISAMLRVTPHVSLPETSPTLRWTGKARNASVFRVWGSRAFNRDMFVDKLSAHTPCVFLGFVPDAPGWQFYNPTSRGVLPSQDVTLQPASPLPAPSSYTEQSDGLTEHHGPAFHPVSTVHTARRAPRLRHPPVPGTHAMALRLSSVPLHVPLPTPPESSLPEVPNPAFDRARAASPTVSRLLAIAVTDTSFESAAVFALVAELLDFAAACCVDYTTALVAESVSATPLSLGGECALGTDVLEDRQEDFECLAAAVPRFASMLLAPEGDPDAPDIPTPRSYAKAITGTYVDKIPPPGANIVDGMWIFRGFDYFQTFSPTPKMTTLRVMLLVAAQRDYELYSLDFSRAFLQGSLHEEIWLRRPPGFTGSFPVGTQWSLRRPVHGLRQAPHEWHDTVRTTLAALGFTPSTAGPFLILRTDTSLPLFYILVYVDGLVFATADTEALTLVKSTLQKRHTCTDLGPSALRLPVILTIAHSSVYRPLALSSTFGRVSRSECTLGMGLVLGGWGLVVLSSHVDASWVDDSTTQRSSQGYTFSLGSGSVSWRSTRSSSVLSSSCEAEIYVGAMAAQELRWLTYLLTDSFPVPHRTAQALYDTVDPRHSSPATAALGCLLLPYLFPEMSAFATIKDLVSHLQASDARYRATVPAEFLATNQPPMFITLYFIVSRLPDSLRSVRDHFLSLDPTSLIVDLLEQHLLAAKTSAVVVGAARGTPRLPFFEGCSPSPLSPSFASAAAADVSVTEDVGATLTCAKRRSCNGKGGRGGGGGCGGGGGGSGSGGGGSGGGGGGSGGGGGGGTGGGSGGSGGGGGGSGGSGGNGGGGSGGGRSGPWRGGPGGCQQQQPHRRSETQSPKQLRERLVQRGTGGGSETCPYVIRTGVCAGQTCGKFHTEHRCFSRLDDAWRAEFGDDGDCYQCVPPDPGIAAAALGASASGTPPGTAPAEALHTFTLDSGASQCFFRDSTTLTPLPAPIPVRLADPSGGLVVARSSTVLLCPAVPSGSLSGLHLPSFSTNLHVHTDGASPGYVHSSARVESVHVGYRASSSRCVCPGVHVRSGRRLLLVSPPVAPDSSVAPPPGSPLLATPSWHALPVSRLWSTHVSASPPALAYPALPSLHRGAAARRSSHLLVSPDDCSPVDSPHGLRLQLCEHFGTDLPVLCLHSDRGEEFSSDLLREFCRGEGILQLFTLPDSPQQNGIVERRIGLVMEVARTSMIHAAAPHLLWPFAVRYAAHQLNL
ncbi:unnamed protein product [Closterium sp. NIES-53]